MGSKLEDRSEYLNCINNTAGCTSLYAANPPTVQRVRACDALSVAEWLGGWVCGMQVPVDSGAYGHHTGFVFVDEPGYLVRFLPPSTLRVALNDGGY